MSLALRWAALLLGTRLPCQSSIAVTHEEPDCKLGGSTLKHRLSLLPRFLFLNLQSLDIQAFQKSCKNDGISLSRPSSPTCCPKKGLRSALVAFCQVEVILYQN